MKVCICTYEDGDLMLKGRVWKNEAAAKESITKEMGDYFSDYGANSFEDMIDFGYITLKTVNVEGF